VAVFRVEKTRDYTVMSNHHLRNESLSLKAKGLLSLFLSLPDNWCYTMKGLASICKDGVDSINAGVKELEKHGYVTRKRVRNDRGQLTETEYTIHEYPTGTDEPDKPETPVTPPSEPKRENPILDNPALGSPEQVSPRLENPALLNIYNNQNTDLLNIDNINQPIYQTQPPNTNIPPLRYDSDMIDANRKMIRRNIEYDILVERYGQDRMNEIVELLLETVCSNRQHINVAGADFPAEVVKKRLLILTSVHIEYVFECLDKNTTKVHNIKKYLLTALFNSTTSMDSYYRAEVNHDMYGK